MGQTTFEIAANIKWPARGIPSDQFPPHQKWFAIGETLARLFYLWGKSQLEWRAAGETFRYSA